MAHLPTHTTPPTKLTHHLTHPTPPTKHHAHQTPTLARSQATNLKSNLKNSKKIEKLSAGKAWPSVAAHNMANHAKS